MRPSLPQGDRIVFTWLLDVFSLVAKGKEAQLAAIAVENKRIESGQWTAEDMEVTLRSCLNADDHSSSLRLSQRIVPRAHHVLRRSLGSR